MTDHQADDARRQYEPPTVEDLGTLEELTRSNGTGANTELDVAGKT